MKATELLLLWYCLLWCTVMYKVVLTFESGNKILKCNHPDENYRAVLSFGSVYYAVHDGSKLEPADKILNMCDDYYSNKRY